MGELTKLRQNSTVKEYQEKFEILANKIQNLPKTFFTSYFISGLMEEIKANVLMFRPTITSQVISLAKLQEYSIEAITRKIKQENGMGCYTASTQTRPSSFQNSVRNELSKELEGEKANGLCFKCYEKYTKRTCVQKEVAVCFGWGPGRPRARIR